VELEHEFCIGRHSIHLMFSTSYVGLGLSVNIGDYSILPQLHLLLFCISGVIDRGRR